MTHKQKMYYVCQQCGYESAKWLGKCPECNSWSTFQEEVRQVPKKRTTTATKASAIMSLLEVKEQGHTRISTGIVELDRTLGGGIIPGSVILIGGDPGIGKSTLMLQVLDNICEKRNIVYVSGEESLNQVNLRARRLGVSNKQIMFSSETNLHNLLLQLESSTPSIVVIDSIQTVYNEEIDSIPGNISQLRVCTAALMRYAKSAHMPLFLIGHVTKEGSLAGPKVLEHMVDTVLYFEGEQQNDYRILRSVKNRFGPVNEIGLFQMTGKGLIGVTNPSHLFLSGNDTHNSGNAIVAVMEGNRPFLVQVQALVTKTQFGIPQRTATGIDHRRMNLLLAVLEKRCGKPFGFHDVFIKVAGGLRIDEPAADLGICMALVSSLDEHLFLPNTVYIGEVGLGAEIRSISRIEARIKEAHKLGFKTIVIPASSKVRLDLDKNKIKQVRNLQELI
jgi:DNA repair protein RadA/Sms